MARSIYELADQLLFERRGDTRETPTTFYELADKLYRRRWRRRGDPASLVLYMTHAKKQMKQVLSVLFLVLGLSVVWYLTPLSEWLSQILLQQVPYSSDITIGHQALRQLRFETIYDPFWTPLLHSVGKDLTKYDEKAASSIMDASFPAQVFSDLFGDMLEHNEPYFEWNFGIIRADVVNAFALPGGIVRVTDKLLRTLVPTRGELAALVGHEMGHVIHRHSQARMLQQNLFHTALRVILLDGTSSVRGQKMVNPVSDALTNAVVLMGELRFSRRDEYQADAMSWNLLVWSGRYSPQSLVSLLEKLSSLEPRSAHPHGSQTSQSLAEWGQTHPATHNRIKALHDKWARLSRSEQKRLARRQS